MVSVKFIVPLKINMHKAIIFLVVPDNILSPSTKAQDTMVLSHSHHDKEFHSIC